MPRLQNKLCLCLVLFVSTLIYIMSTLDGNNRKIEPSINLPNGDQLSKHKNKPERSRHLKNINEKQEEGINPMGAGYIIKHKGDINSVRLEPGIMIKQRDTKDQPIEPSFDSGVPANKASNKSQQQNGHRITKERPHTQDIYKRASVYTFAGGSWQSSSVCKPYKLYEGNSNFHLATSLSSAGSVQMFVHNPKNDAISSTILQRHSFERELVDFALFMLRKDPTLSLIDIGSNVGLFTMATALLGRNVIAIDAVGDNIRHVCASVEYHKYTNRVFLINNAVSNTHGKVNIKMGGTGDFGLSHINDVDINSKMDKRFSEYFQNSKFISADLVTLDDFLSFPNTSIFENIFIKMDVEGNEHKVLLGAKEFMKKKNVKGIVMEWEWVSGGSSETTILSLMADWKFVPHQCNTRLDLLSLNNIGKWPMNVVWLPRDTK